MYILEDSALEFKIKWFWVQSSPYLVSINVRQLITALKNQLSNKFAGTQDGYNSSILIDSIKF